QLNVKYKSNIFNLLDNFTIVVLLLIIKSSEIISVVKLNESGSTLLELFSLRLEFGSIHLSAHLKLV
ncbi:Unknown protein, partial [Striga hermonthica]